MAKVRQHSGDNRLHSTISNKPMELGKRGAEQGGDTLKEQLREAYGRNDSAEEYGGDKVERAAETASENAVRTAEKMGSRINEKITDKVCERFECDERQPEQVRERPDAEAPQRESNEAVRGDSPIKERHRTSETHGKLESIREKDISDYEKPSEQVAVREKEYSNKYGESEHRADIKEKTEASQRTVKTKDQYIREQAKAPEAKPEAVNKQIKPQTSRASNTRPVAQRFASTTKAPAQTAEKGTIKVAEKGFVKTAQAAGKGTVKATKTGVKTAERTAKTSAKAAKATVKAAQKAAQPGDIIFWQKPSCHCGRKYAEVHHTGFYLGDGMILDASSSNGRVIIRKLFSGSSYKVYAYARPYSY